MGGLDKGLYMGGTEILDPNDQDSVINDDVSIFTEFSNESDADEDIPYENPQTGQRSRKREHSPATQGESVKRNRIPGGRPATNKPVTEHPDSDDQRILDLKKQGYNDDFICNKLAEEGRIRYKKGTINCRVKRYQDMFEKAEDERLDDELYDWLVGEDDKLEQSVVAADMQFQRDLQKLIDKKWKDVSVVLANLLPDEKKKYTANACKERWEAVQTGTALMPLELDPDQEGRKMMRESRIAEAKRLREEAKEEEERAKLAEEAARSEKKQQKTQKAQEYRKAKQAREAEKAEDRRIAAERRAGKAEKAAKKKQAREAWRADLDEKKRIKELEERIYRSITGKALNRMRRVSEIDGINEDAQGNSDGENVHYADEEDNQPDEMVDLTGDREEDQYPEGREVSKAKDVTPKKTPRAKTTTAALNNPRSIMNDEELRLLLCQRGLPPRANNESRSKVIARLAKADNDLSSSALEGLLRYNFLNHKGNKEVKILRLQQYDADKSAAGQLGVQ